MAELDARSITVGGPFTVYADYDQVLNIPGPGLNLEDIANLLVLPNEPPPAVLADDAAVKAAIPNGYSGPPQPYNQLTHEKYNALLRSTATKAADQAAFSGLWKSQKWTGPRWRRIGRARAGSTFNMNLFVPEYARDDRGLGVLGNRGNRLINQATFLQFSLMDLSPEFIEFIHGNPPETKVEATATDQEYQDILLRRKQRYPKTFGCLVVFPAPAADNAGQQLKWIVWFPNAQSTGPLVLSGSEDYVEQAVVVESIEDANFGLGNLRMGIGPPSA